MSSKNAARLSIFCAVAAVFIWVWEDDAALNAAVLFVTAGVIPGTSVTLTPGQMYVVLGVLLAVVFGLLCARMMSRGVWRMRIFWRGGRAAVAAYKEAVEAVGAPQLRPGGVLNVPALAIRHAADTVEQAVSPKPPAKPKSKSMSKTQAAAEASEPAIVITLLGGPGRIAGWWERVRPGVIAAVGGLLEYILEGMHVVDGWVRQAIESVRDGAMAAWGWAEPRIRAFDKQIEHTLKGNKHTAAALKAGDAAVKSTVAYTTLVRTKMGQRLSRTHEE